MKSRVRQQPAQFSAAFGILIITILAVLDQTVKYLAVRFLRGNPALELIPGVLELSYLENRGMAFGLFQGRIPFFLIVCVMFFAAAGFVLAKMPKTRYYRPLAVTIYILLSGALGNFIDRIFRGYVVDFIYLSLIHFPTFNLADIYVTCGAAVLILLVFLRYRDEEDFNFLRIEKKV